MKQRFGGGCNRVRLLQELNHGIDGKGRKQRNLSIGAGSLGWTVSVDSAASTSSAIQKGFPDCGLETCGNEDQW
jgi:hypothetical protein